MNRPQKRAPVRYFAALCDQLAKQGVDTASLLRSAGIEPERLQRADATLVASEVDDFIVAARRITGRGDLGFEIGRLIKINSHDLLGYAMLSSRNVDQMIRLAARYYHVMTEMFTMRYQRKGEVGETIYTPTMAMPLETLRFYYEAVAVAHHNQVNLMLGGTPPAYDIYLAMPAPPHASRYLTLAPTRFHFDEHASAPGVRVRMEAALLDKPLPMAADQVVRQVEARLRALQHRPAPDEGWGDYILMMLRVSQGEQLTLDDIARRLQISARTIDRNLKKENFTFRQLAQQVQLERARELLAAPGATVSAVAEQLGFSDTANFTRAFRRMAGMSPSQFQESHKA